MEEIEFSRWLFEGRLRQCKNVLSDGLNWLCYVAGSSKSHRENSIRYFHILGIPSSSRLEKCCQILQTLFWVFQYSRSSHCAGLIYNEFETAKALGTHSANPRVE